MPKRRTASVRQDALLHAPKRDVQLCKSVFGAAISQILYARRGFPPDYFQVLPLNQLLSRSFEDIIASGSSLQTHDREASRDQSNTVYLRASEDYAVRRFIGILQSDIFPLLESERLVKFRINYLCGEKWKSNCLREYYTITFKYEPDGRCGLDIWRAGTGRQHISKTCSKLWDLGDYLSRLPLWKESTHWTLAFHATERPEDPPIGVWKFDHTEFDDANLSLQQQDDYSYERVAHFNVMPCPLEQNEEVVPETCPDPEHEPSIYDKAQSGEAGRATVGQARKRQKTTQKTAKRVTKLSQSQGRIVTGTQLSPPRTLNTQVKASAQITTNEQSEHELGAKTTRKDTAQSNNETRPTDQVRKRKPKKPLQIFEDLRSSLPPTQLIGESQSLGKTNQPTKTHDGDLGPALAQQQRMNISVPRSISPADLKLLDGISLSSETTSAYGKSPGHTSPQLPQLLRQVPTSQPSAMQRTPMEGTGDPSIRSQHLSVSSAPRNTQWVPRAFPPETMLGIVVSDDGEGGETASERDSEPAPDARETLPRPPTPKADSGITITFSPNTVDRRRMLLYDLPSSDEDDE